MGHLLMENCNGLVVDARLTPATGAAERETAAAMVGDLPARGRITLGADKLYDTRAFVAEMRSLDVTPHVAQDTNKRRSAIPTASRTMGHRAPHCDLSNRANLTVMLYQCRNQRWGLATTLAFCCPGCCPGDEGQEGDVAKVGLTP